jgi:membrane protein DedA with SNARE-associated domain
LVSQLLESIPPEAIYLIVGLLIMVESLGIPLPGEIALATAAVLATQHKIAVAPEWIAVSGSLGAIAGDSIGFYVGHRVGKPLFDWLGRKFPRHFGPSHVAVAERFFTRHGAWAVFFGRFIALLRIFSGPLAGSLHMPYDRFLLANASGGIVWASGLTYLIYYLGQAAEKWLSRVSWIGLVVAVVIGVAITLLIRRRTSKLVREHEAESSAAPAASSSEAAAASQAEAEDAPVPAEDAPVPAEAANAAPPAGEEDGPAPAGKVVDPALPPSGNGEARLPAVNGQAEPPARQRTESDR